MARLSAVQIAVAAFPLLLCGVMPALPPAAFAVLALLGGALGGYQFVVATRVYFAGQDNDRRSAGALYGMDLAGACLGALAFGAWLVPLLGFMNTALLAAAVNLAPATAAALAARRIPAR